MPIEFLAAVDLAEAHDAMIEQSGAAVIILGNQQRDFNAAGAAAEAAHYIAFLIPIPAAFRVSQEDARYGLAVTQPLQNLNHAKRRSLVVSGVIQDAVSDNVMAAFGFCSARFLLARGMVILFKCDRFHVPFVCGESPR